jgi:thioredoxin-like negative regulator of GroEL
MQQSPRRRVGERPPAGGAAGNVEALVKQATAARRRVKELHRAPGSLANAYVGLARRLDEINGMEGTQAAYAQVKLNAEMRQTEAEMVEAHESAATVESLEELLNDA